MAWLQSPDVERAVKEWKPDIVQLQTMHNFLGFGPAHWVQEHQFPHVWALMDYWPFCASRMLLLENNATDVACNAVTGRCDNACGRHAAGGGGDGESLARHRLQ